MLVLLDKIRMKSNLCLQYKREKELKDAKDELRKFTDRPAQQQTWKQMDNERQKLRNRIWATNRKIYGQKCAISSYPVIPLIIPKVVSLQ